MLAHTVYTLVLWRFWNWNRNRSFNPKPNRNRNLKILQANYRFYFRYSTD